MMTITEPEALEAMLAHHRALEEGVQARVDEFVTAAARGEEPAGAGAKLVAYLAAEILPHAQAEEQTVYRSAAGNTALAETLEQMIAEHRTLAETAGRLAGSPGSADAPIEAEQLAILFSAHVAKENTIVLPALIAEADVDLAAVLAEMHGLIEASRQAPEAAEQPGSDSTGVVVHLMLRALAALAKAGEGDQASRLAARAWAALREDRPDLAVRVTAALHGLTRQVESAPVAASESGPVDPARADTQLDVRPFAPAQRHQLIFKTYDELAPGTGFILINDHDPKPLGYQFEAEHPGRYTWDYLEAGPTVWRVRIGRPAAGGAVTAGTPGSESEELPELDVRTLPHVRRHDSIFAAYLALAPGAGFALVNDHDPRPLAYQFEAQFPGQYSWDYLEAGPAVWRVRIGRPAR